MLYREDAMEVRSLRLCDGPTSLRDTSVSGLAEVRAEEVARDRGVFGDPSSEASPFVGYLRLNCRDG
jgi:hypothetical protein